MRILTRRTWMVLLLLLTIILGLFIFSGKYIRNASVWVQHPTNKHLYSNGQFLSAGTIYDRNGEVLFEMSDGVRRYHKDKTVRTALMHAVGDLNRNVETSAQVAFREKLSGWSLVTGAYRFKKQGEIRSDLTLTLDADLCAEAYKALNGRKGTVGVYNYKTGDIVCMVSSPTFDPENQPNVEANQKKYEGVYINRFLSAAYTPGSVFKLVTAAAAIDNLENLNSKTYYCRGEMKTKGETVTCLSNHGNISFEDALAKSCNVAFAEISLSLGGKTLQKYAEKAGFNSGLKVDNINTTVGKVDIANAKGGDLAWAGIGQYNNTANPLNFMAYVGSIANDGISIPPRILKKKELFSSSTSYAKKEKEILSEDTAYRLKVMMRNNVIENYGERNYKGLELCAKTGTAEVGGDQKPHAWFVGFLDRSDYPLAFVVVVENGGTGSKVAAPIANKVLQFAVRTLVIE